MSKKNTISYLLSTAAIALFTLLACYISGVVNMFCGIFVSVLLGMQVIKYHYGLLFPSVSLVLLIPFLAMTALPDTQLSFRDTAIYALNFALPLILMGFTLGFALKFKLSFSKTLLILAAIYLVGTLIHMQVLSSMFPEHVSLDSALSIAVEQAIDSFSKAYAAQPETLKALESMLALFTRLIMVLTPSIFILVSLFVAYLCFAIFKKYISTRGEDVSFWPAFSELSSDAVSSALFLILLVVFMFAPDGIISDAVVNVLLVLAAIFTFYGLSYIDWKMCMMGFRPLPRRLIVILSVPFGTLIFPFLLLVFIAIGVLNGFMDLRNRSKDKANYL
ncbi:MAG: DUF2232 domain-containing protein [Clostridia bacterium]|nr:DUF2232 domain-containing protein [Clostridia bacterium]MBQ3554284.1 DUF2232 domain-containing protein [Clostridia bacterium]